MCARSYIFPLKKFTSYWKIHLGWFLLESFHDTDGRYMHAHALLRLVVFRGSTFVEGSLWLKWWRNRRSSTPTGKRYRVEQAATSRGSSRTLVRLLSRRSRHPLKEVKNKINNKNNEERNINFQKHWFKFELMSRYENGQLNFSSRFFFARSIWKSYQLPNERLRVFVFLFETMASSVDDHVRFVRTLEQGQPLLSLQASLVEEQPFPDDWQNLNVNN